MIGTRGRVTFDSNYMFLSSLPPTKLPSIKNIDTNPLKQSGFVKNSLVFCRAHASTQIGEKISSVLSDSF